MLQNQASLNPIPYLLETLHPKSITFDRFVGLLRFKKGPKLPRTASLSDSKVGRDKLSLNRINRCYRFLSKKICSFLYQNLMSRARNFGFLGQKH